MMSTRRCRSWGFLLPFLSWILVVGSACVGGEAQPENTPEIVLAWISPGVDYPTTSLGAILAAEEIAEQGGLEVDGRRVPVRLEVIESTNSPETATSQALALVNLEGAVGLLGLASTSTAMPVARVAEKHRVPMLTILSSHPEVTANRRFSFRLTADDPTQGQALATAARRLLQADNAGLLIDVSNPYCVSLSQAFSAAFEGLGGSIRHTETYTEDQESLDAVFDRLAAADLDLLLLPNVSPLNEPALAAARARGFSIPILGGDSWAATLPEDRGKVDDLYFLDLWAPETEPGARQFEQRILEHHGLAANSTMALGYDAVTLVAEAIRRQGLWDGEAIRDGLSSIEHFPGLGGPYSFTLGAANPRRQLYLRHQTGGEARLVDTLEITTLEPQAPETAR